jgi:capsular polysaccharide biosynthesis protein
MNKEEVDLLKKGLRRAVFEGDLAATQDFFGKVFHAPRAVAVDGVTLSRLQSLRAWCEQSGVELRELEPACAVAVKTTGRTYTALPFTAAQVPHGEALIGWDFVRTAEGAVLAESHYQEAGITYASWFPHVANISIGRIAHLWPADVNDIDEDVLVLSGPAALHTGHWIVDFLPRLRARACVPDGHKIKVAVPAELPVKHRKMLALLGIAETDVINIPLGTRCRFRSTLVAVPGDHHNPQPENIRFVTAGFRLAPLPPPAGGVFLTRDTGTRAIVNQAEVDRLLEDFGFTKLSLSTATITEQRRVLGAARTVIGTYGSDLLVMYFMQPGARLIELNGTSHDAGFAAMCQAVGVDHRFVWSQPSENRGAQLYKKDADFIVDCDALRAAVAAP